MEMETAEAQRIFEPGKGSARRRGDGMRVLLTGGAGFIGANLAHHIAHRTGQVSPTCCDDQSSFDDASSLLPDDTELMVVDKVTYAGDPSRLQAVEKAITEFERTDISDANAIEGLFDRFEPDAVIHLAAESHVDRSIEGGQVFVETNVLGTQILLDVARRHDVEKFLHVSTDEVYGSIEQGSFSEDAPLDPSSPYSASKAGSDLIAHSHQETYGTPVAITRCTNNYGPRQHEEKLIPKMISLASRGEKLPVYGDGQNVRDWLYVKDHCQALLRILRDGEFDGSVYNVAGQDERTNIEIVEAILDRLDQDEDLIEFVEDRPGHDYRYSLDDRKIRDLGWEPRVSFEEGIVHAINDVVPAKAPGGIP